MLVSSRIKDCKNFATFANLVALAGWSTRFAGIRTRCGMRDDACVTWTLCALAGDRIYVMSSWTWYTRRAGGLGAEGTSPARGGDSINGVAYCDGIDPRHVIDPPPYLRERGIETNGLKISCETNSSRRWKKNILSSPSHQMLIINDKHNSSQYRCLT